MKPVKPLSSCQSGATIVLVAVVSLVLLTVMALVIDTARIYAVQNKAQNASDAALLGAIATVDSSPVSLEEEIRDLFYANYPVGYLGSSVGDFSISQVNNVYTITFEVTVPTLFVGLFGENFNIFPILSEVTRGFDEEKLELAMVLDNTGSMSQVGPDGLTKMEGLKNASHALIDILFADEDTSDNIHISLVPYTVDVNVGPNRESWVQSSHVPQYQAVIAAAAAQGFTAGFMSNRNADNPPNGFNDISDAAPATEATRFRVPPYYHLPDGTILPPPAPPCTPPVSDPVSPCFDITYPNLAPLRFGINDKNVLGAAIDDMNPDGYTRINIGLMWGWFTLSPNWQGLWDAGQPGLPEQPSEPLNKSLILMTDGLNTVYTGVGGISNDDQTTAALCEAVKAQGITVYTVGFGENVNQSLLENCASLPTFYWFAPDSAALEQAFEAIGDNILFNTIRLSQ